MVFNTVTWEKGHTQSPSSPPLIDVNSPKQASYNYMVGEFSQNYYFIETLNTKEISFVKHTQQLCTFVFSIVTQQTMWVHNLLPTRQFFEIKQIN